jgi:P4 family phage/plasmid primase-like protien
MPPSDIGGYTIAGPNKCIHCGAEITGEGTECYKCIDNPKRQETLKKWKKKPLIYHACPNEHEVLEIVEYADDCSPSKWKCPKCREETTEPHLLEYAPKIYSYADFCDDPEKKKGFKPARVAERIKAYFLFQTDRASGVVYRYDEERGVWRDDGEAYLKELTAEMLSVENRQSHFNNILHHLKSITYHDVTFKTKFVATPKCLLNVEARTIKEFTPNEMTRFSIPTEYKPDAKCPNWEQFISQVVAHEDAASLQEFTGYLLLPTYLFHKILWIHGEGRNGKGVYTRTVEALIGKENCSGVGLEEFDGNHRFAVAQLSGKLFNPCSEPPTNRVLQTTLLKRATGQDTINAELKGKNERLIFTNCAKITIIGNKFPRVNDTTLAFTDRMMFIKFPNTFVGENQIQNLERIWLENPEEMSGILNWALEGLHRLLSQRQFTESRTQRETEIEFKRASDSIGAFLAERGIYGAKLIATRSEAYDNYKEYCEEIGVQPESDRVFTQRMKQTRNVKDAKSQGKRQWQGVAFKQTGADGAVGADTPYYGKYGESEKLERYVECAPVAPSAPNPDRKCSDFCFNFDRAGCPLFCKINEDSIMPLKCPSFKPSEEMPNFDGKSEPSDFMGVPP